MAEEACRPRAQWAGEEEIGRMVLGSHVELVYEGRYDVVKGHQGRQRAS